MLGVASPTITKGENQRRQSMVDSINPVQDEDFHDFTDANLLESINFDDLFMDELPDLEMDPEILTEFSGCGGGSREQSEIVNPSVSDEKAEENPRGREEDKDSGSGGSGLESSLSVSKGEEIASKRDEDVDVKPKGGEGSKGKKSSCTQEKNNNNIHGKRKVKVDWTPELHRRFVQAVEQLGVDKAVPSRILEIMGIDCLTRHNIASHLQKYRSHRKHLLAREAEAANWSQRRQMYGAAAVAAGGTKRDPWHAPTMGFPPITPMHPHHFRPLHVWGHPSMEQSLLQNHIWSNHPPPPHAWGISPPDPSYWHHHRPVPNGLSTPATPCFPPAMPPARFAAPPMLGILPHPHPMHKVVGEKFDPHPSKESIDEAIGDVLTKPWLPLPLGLKPPSIDSVTVELQRQGIARIPPPTSCN